MPRIKWIGIIQGEIAQYQEGELNTDAKKLDMPSAMNDMMLKALPFCNTLSFGTGSIHACKNILVRSSNCKAGISTARFLRGIFGVDSS